MFEADPRKAFEKKLVELGGKKTEILTVSCDSAKGAGMSSFVEAFPERHIEVGISEQTAIGVCAGLAETGYIPVISAITPFVTMRSYEFIRNDIGYSNMNVKIFGSGAGMAYSTLGSSHSVIEDIGVMGTIPNLTILNPGDGYEVEEALRLAIEHIGPVYVRMPRQKQRQISVKRDIYELGKSKLLREGVDVLFLVTGTMINRTLDAARLLDNHGVQAAVKSYLTIKPLDSKSILEDVMAYQLVVTVEEHSIHGGFGSMVANILCQSKKRPVLEIIGIEKNDTVGPYEEVLDTYGLSPNNISERVLSKLKEIS